MMCIGDYDLLMGIVVGLIIGVFIGNILPFKKQTSQ